MEEILVVDDERAIRNGMRSMLLAEGFEVRLANNGDEALSAFRERRPSLVLLDVMMPKRNGFSVCAEIRSIDPLTPIIFLTAKDGEAEQVRGFGLGADDYVSKSASEAELVARIRRAIDRASAYNSVIREKRKLEIGDVVVDVDSQTLLCDGEIERMTKTEADIIWLLGMERGKIVSYDEIIDVLKAGGFTGDYGAIQTYVSRIKKKLGRAGSLLKAERGVGYRLLR